MEEALPGAGSGRCIPVSENREVGANPTWPRHCNRRNALSDQVTGQLTGKAESGSREPGDLPEP